MKLRRALIIEPNKEILNNFICDFVEAKILSRYVTSLKEFDAMVPNLKNIQFVLCNINFYKFLLDKPRRELLTKLNPKYAFMASSGLEDSPVRGGKICLYGKLVPSSAKDAIKFFLKDET
jgi:hypothetical protein